MRLTFPLLFTPLALASSLAMATSIQPPQLYGELQGRLRWEDGQDYQSEINSATVGLIGLHKIDSLVVRYQLAADYFGGRDEKFRVSEANLILIEKTLGNIYFGDGMTGTYNDLYSLVDIFDSNNMDVSSNGSLYKQAKEGTNMFSYGTPSWGGVHFNAAVITPNDSNDQDVDMFGLRATYRQENFSLILNRSQLDKKFLNVNNDYVRYALASRYQYQNFYVAGLVEVSLDDPQGDNHVYGVSSQYKLDPLTFKLGAQVKTFDDASLNDETLYLGSVSYAFDAYFSSYVEVAEYQTNNKRDKSKQDNINVGMIFAF